MGGSKKYKGKLCVYCCNETASTADHVFPRELFKIEKRDGIPKVPACKSCNNSKSKIEHYLASVLPFAGNHEDSVETLSTEVPKRLRKNLKLRRELQSKYTYKNILYEDGDVENRMLIEFDYDALEQFIQYIGKALLYYHWDVYLPSDYDIFAFLPAKEGMDFVKQLFGLSSNKKVTYALGNDTVRYIGTMSESEDGLSVWAIQIFNGLTVSDGNVQNVVEQSFMVVITGPKKTIQGLRETFGT
ncbi:HNH endonuclease [Reinekea sp. G2M2-21]|uniref:HNH endonuclease n=1 Tax=Reinekea sp. G2M2-21 TaxID=2788942 RepID=UPI0018A8C653|nr:hypothetical protein [Reinekea sp. G2M2-21]